MPFESLEAIYNLSIDLNSENKYNETTNFCTALKVISAYEAALKALRAEVEFNEDKHKTTKVEIATGDTMNLVFKKTL